MNNVTHNSADVNQWKVAGADVIPTHPDSKKAICLDWPNLPASEQWKQARARYPRRRPNFVLRLGKERGIIDADNSHTVVYVCQYLEDRDIDYLVVRTKGGCHYHLRMRDVPEDFNWRKLRSDLKGELRAGKGATAMLPGNVVKGYTYTSNWGIEEWQQLRPCNWSDLIDLLPKEKPLPKRDNVILIPKQDAPVRVYELLGELITARKGQSVGGYPSRSEAELAVVYLLIVSGWSLADIAAEFVKWLPGHYREKKGQQAKYLEHTYQAALRRADTSERAKILELYREMKYKEWKGRAGNSRRATMLGVLNIAYQYSSVQVYASYRQIGEAAKVSYRTVGRAIHWLQHYDYLVILSQHTGDKGTLYQLSTHLPSSIPTFGKLQNTKTDTLNTIKGKDGGKIDIISEVFGWGRIGQSAAPVYAFLTDDPLTAKELSALTGKHVQTVRASLKRLAEYDLAKGTNTRPVRWTKGDRTLGDVEQEWEADKLADARRARHQRERRKWQAKLAKWGR